MKWTESISAKKAYNPEEKLPVKYVSPNIFSHFIHVTWSLFIKKHKIRETWRFCIFIHFIKTIKLLWYKNVLGVKKKVKIKSIVMQLLNNRRDYNLINRII